MKKLFIFLLLFLMISSCYALETNCPNLILIEASTGRVIFEKNSKEHVAPASTTKIMTAILTFEKGNLKDNVTASYDAIMSVPSGGSNTAIQVGEMLTVEQLLNCLLVASGNEAANVLAEYISGSTEEFAKLMNEKAIELGCNDTHFVNANGLSEEGHYSCAHDLAIMYKYAFENFEEFRKIVSKTSYSLPTSEKYSKEDRNFNNTNKLIIPTALTNEYYYEYCTGGKTGYTTEAKNCLVSSASKNGIDLVCVVLGGTTGKTNESYRYTDTINLFNYGFNNLKRAILLNEGTIVKKITVENAKPDDNEVSAVASKTLTLVLDSGDTISSFETEVFIYDDLVAPIESGEKLGFIRYNVYDSTYYVDLLSNRFIDEKPKITIGQIIGTVLLYIFRFLVIVVLIVVIARFYNVVIRKKNKRSRIMSTRRYNARFHK